MFLPSKGLSCFFAKNCSTHRSDVVGTSALAMMGPPAASGSLAVSTVMAAARRASPMIMSRSVVLALDDDLFALIAATVVTLEEQSHQLLCRSVSFECV